MDAYILAGGKSQRFGSNKALAFWQGKPFVIHQQNLLRPHFKRVYVIAARAETYAGLNLDIIQDNYAECGPLGGLEAALQHTRHDWIFLASCDTFGVTSHQIQTLVSQCQQQPAKADIYAWQYERIEPLWACYARSLLTEVQKQLRQKQFALQSLIKKSRAQIYLLDTPWLQVNHTADIP